MPDTASENVAVTLQSGQRLGQWSEVELQFGLDSYSAISLSGPFDYQRKEIRAALQPLRFPLVTVTIGDELVLTGRVKDVSPTVDAGAATVGVTVYSLAHDLTEVCPPHQNMPLEFNDLDLRQITQRLVTRSVGILGVFENLPGARFARIRCEPDREIHPFICELALQRGFVLSDLPSGDLLFRNEAPTGSPRARFKGLPLGRVTAEIQAGSWFTWITGRATKRAGKKGSKYTHFNPLYRGDNPRAFTATVSDTEAADVPKAVAALVGRMVASVVAYTIEDLPTWRDPSGALWRPNTTITLEAPEAMVYRETELLIRHVTFKQTAGAETATLRVVLPGTFGGALPEELPWED